MAETPDTLARQWFREVWVQGDESAIDRLMHPEAVAHGLTAEPIRGPAQFKPYYRALKSALSGIQIVVLRTVVDGDVCAIHCQVKAIHSGGTLGAPASGRAVDFGGVTILRVAGGRIVEGWNCFDFLTMYQQIGWVRNPVLP